MRAIRWSESALADLEGQFDYIASNNPSAARRVAARLRSVAEALGDMPTGRKGRVDGTYEKVIPGLPYIIAYAITTLPNGSQAVDILRIIHGARNWHPGEWPE